MTNSDQPITLQVRCTACNKTRTAYPVRGGLAIVHVERINLALAVDVSAKDRIA
jgi:hypothetical protein